MANRGRRPGTRAEEKPIAEVAESHRRGTGRYGPGQHPNSRANLVPWKPGQSGNPAGPGPRRSFIDDARAILDGGVPANLRDLVSRRTGMPLKSVDQMTLRQVVVLHLVYDYLKQGKLDALAQLLDRTDPKTRRVEGKMDHEHTLRGVIASLGVGEVQAAEIYKGLLEGGTVELGPGSE